MRYIPKPGAPLSKKDAARVAEVANQLAAKKIPINKENILKSGHSKRSPIHHLFEWDNKKCGHLWRLKQARVCVQSITIKVMSAKEPVRAFVPVRVERKGRVSREWLPRREVIRNDDLLEQASHDLYQRLYNVIVEAEGFGLGKDPAWKKIITTVKHNKPAASLLAV